ncbi:O-antigen ligase family protein [Salinicoccus sesuvii]|uniref:O-antigen ligase family protein n=1 Tax=Salinicoccus sesuvii TaxID=868281 RepID=UPI003608CC82
MHSLYYITLYLIISGSGIKVLEDLGLPFPLLVLILCFLSIALFQKSIKFSKYDLKVFVFLNATIILYIFLGSVNGNYFDVINQIYYFICAILFFSTLVSTTTKESFKNIKFTVYISIIYMCLIAINIWLFQNDIIVSEEYFKRAISIFGNPNILAQNLLLLLPIIMVNIGKQKFLLFMSTTLYLVTLFLTQSRGSILVSAILILLFLLRKKNLKLRYKLTLVTLAIVSLKYLTTDTNRIYLNRILPSNMDDYSNSRLDALLTGINSFWQSFFGVGIGNTNINELSLSSHNAYIDFVSETGVIGLLILLFYISILLIAWTYSTKKPQSIAYYLIPTLMFVSIFTHNLITNISFYFVLAVLVYEFKYLKGVKNE